MGIMVLEPYRNVIINMWAADNLRRFKLGILSSHLSREGLTVGYDQPTENSCHTRQLRLSK